MGVTTGRSTALRMWPQWMAALGRPEVQIQGVDFRLHDEPARYGRLVQHVKDDPLALGALVTTHKIDLLDAARDLFDELSPHARLCGEVSSIAKRGGRLVGHATDPEAGGISLDAILGEGYFGRTGGEVLCFGAGGSATALALHLMCKPHAADQPRRCTVVNRSQARLDRLAAMIAQMETDIDFRLICNADPAANDRLMAALPDGSLVVNATGMGKDIPGSPVTGDGLFPHRGVAWELNYRGELDFLQQARSQQASRGLTVEDGWHYFLLGWTQVIQHVLDIEIDEVTCGRLAEIAATLRGN